MTRCRLGAFTHRKLFQFVPRFQDSVRAGQVDSIDEFAVVEGLEDHLQGRGHWMHVHRFQATDDYAAVTVAVL